MDRWFAGTTRAAPSKIRVLTTLEAAVGKPEVDWQQDQKALYRMFVRLLARDQAINYFFAELELPMRDSPDLDRTTDEWASRDLTQHQCYTTGLSN
jgi:hypothetical protein